MESIKLAGIGIILGITTVIPGVSTGTIAVVLNVYDRLIEVITPNVKKILAAWKFLIPLVIGIGAGIVFFSRIITILFKNYPVPTYWFFIGVIAGSLPVIYQRVLRPNNRTETLSAEGRARPSFSAVMCCVIALAFMALMAVINPSEEKDAYTVLTPRLFLILTAGGALAAAAMILPGTSGSFLLLVTGLYRTVIQAVSELNIPLIIPVALGSLIGLLAGAALVRLLLAKVPKETYGAVLGLVAGSIMVLYPGGFGNGREIIFSAAAMLAGAALSFFFGKKRS